jgi:hypothetical protein
MRDTDLARLRREHEGLERQAARLLDLYQQGELDADMWRDRMTTLRVRLEINGKEQASLSDLAARKEAARTKASTWKRRAKDFKTAASSADEGWRRLFMETLRLRVYTDGKTATIDGLPRPATITIKRPRKRYPGGEPPFAKLSYLIAEEIRRKHAAGGVTMTALAREHECSVSTVSSIVHGRLWAAPYDTFEGYEEEPKHEGDTAA